jgi:phytoene/squalene synthetase
MQIYNKTAYNIAAIVTRNYSNSFYLSTLLLEKKVKESIHGIYCFVRFADEIVDTFHEYDKTHLLLNFEKEVYEAIEKGISLNPVLHAFQSTVNKHNIPHKYIDSFLKSMKMDLNKTKYLTKTETEEYVYGSANVVGLMCLKVFCNNDEKLFGELVTPAQMLGSAFQKVNFLRDLKADTEGLKRFYFSNFDTETFNESTKNELINEIADEFNTAYNGIIRLPGKSKLAVLTAYYYYLSLLRKIKKTDASTILNKRVRISNSRKISLMAKAIIAYKLKLI